MDRFDSFIANLYRSSAFIKAEHFREWALLQLRELVPFDAALWGSGNLLIPKFHTMTLLGLSDKYAKTLEQTNEVNPIWKGLINNLDKTLDSSTLVPDSEFYKSPIYKRCFKKFKIERILTTLHNDNKARMATLLSVYRFDRDNKFSTEDHANFTRAVQHLTNAASHAYFTHLIRTAPDEQAHSPAAVCDREGYLYEVQPQFLDIMEEHFPDWKGPCLPFTLAKCGERFSHEGVCGKTEALDDLICIQIWKESPLDMLTNREREVVEGVCQGMTFKEIAKTSKIAPSTVSNHLYRIYRKLGVNNRSSLAKMVKTRRGPKVFGAGKHVPRHLTH